MTILDDSIHNGTTIQTKDIKELKEVVRALCYRLNAQTKNRYVPYRVNENGVTTHLYDTVNQVVWRHPFAGADSDTQVELVDIDELTDFVDTLIAEECESDDCNNRKVNRLGRVNQRLEELKQLKEA